MEGNAKRLENEQARDGLATPAAMPIADRLHWDRLVEDKKRDINILLP